MSKKSFFQRLFPQAVPKVNEAEKRKKTRGIVANLSNGNVSLQMGHYATEEDLQAKKKRILKHKFA